jgi:hypothetical protein
LTDGGLTRLRLHGSGCAPHTFRSTLAFARWQADGLIVHIGISLARQHAAGTAVGICHTYTAVNDADIASLAGMAEDAWLDNMAFWQRSMNAWLGKQAVS